MYLSTDKIYLREVRLSDLTQGYCDWLNDPEVNRYLETRFYIQTLADIKEYWENYQRDADEPWFAICKKDQFGGEEHIGNIKLGPISWVHRRAEVSLVLKKEYWGRGYGSEAINLISRYAFQTLDLHKLTAGIYDLNKGSKRAFENVGFNREALLVNHVFLDGKYEDVILMAKFNDS